MSKWKEHSSGGGNAVYCLGVIGALIYFIQTAGSFMDGLVGVIKAFLWPAYFVFEVFKYLKL